MNKLLAMGLVFALALVAAAAFGHEAGPYGLLGSALATWLIPGVILAFGGWRVSLVRVATALIVGTLFVYFGWYEDHHASASAEVHR